MPRRLKRPRGTSRPVELIAAKRRDIGKARLRRLMKKRAIQRADLDLRMAEEWFPVDQEAWESRKK